jgi:hypothetical protein
MIGKASAGAPRNFFPLILLPGLLAPFAAGVAFLAARPWVLPVLATAAVYPVFAGLILRGRRGAAVAAALLWAASLSSTIILVTARDPGRAGAAVLNGPAYRDEMFAYVRTGHGREMDPARFLPQHALHLVGFAMLSLLTAGLLGIAMGSVLVGYMSYYVGCLAAAGSPHLAFLFGWPPWAVLRVVGFVLLGAVLSRPVLARVTRRVIPAAGERRTLVAAAVLLVLDVLLKTLLASHWPVLLRPCLGG